MRLGLALGYAGARVEVDVQAVQDADRLGYHFTRCMWAEVYRELGEPDLGFVICSSDEPAVKAHNAQLGFSRTQVLMHGAPLCNHVFFVETEQA